MSFYDAIRVGASGAADYEIERSLRFDRNDNHYLTRTPSSAGNRKTMTFSAWFKLGQNGVNSTLNNGNGLFLSCGAGSNAANMTLRVTNNGYIGIDYYGIGGYYSTGRLRDPSAWYHLVWVIDTTQSTSTNRLKVYVNNELYLSSDLGQSQNADIPLNNNSATTIGAYSYNTSHGYRLDGYLTEVHFLDGYAYDPTYFAETNSTTGQWVAKKYAGAYGTNGFYLNFSDTSSTTAATLGKDYSGNGNNFTPNNFGATLVDSSLDTPTNNFCTLNPLDRAAAITIQNGNLQIANSSTGNYNGIRASFGSKTGKYYWEIKFPNTGYLSAIGIARADGRIDNGNQPTYRIVLGLGSWYNSYNSGGVATYVNATPSGDYPNVATWSGASNYSNNDIYMIAVDFDTGKIWWGKNNSWFNNTGTADPSTGTDPRHTFTTGNEWFPYSQEGDSSSCNQLYNFGQQGFAYTPPTGFVALNSANLPDPTILLPENHFNTLLWDGDSANSRDITGLNFKPDWVWIKSRSHSSYGGGLNYNHVVWDALRGVGSNTTAASGRKELTINENYAEGTTSNYTNYYGHVSAFNSNGFTLGKISGEPALFTNLSGRTYVGWNWNAGDTDGATYTVKVVSDSGNKYRFNDFGTSAVTLDLAEGGTYTFDGSDSSMSGHPFVIGTAANGSEYSTGVTYQLDGASVTYSQYTSGYSSATTRKLIITVPASAPQLYYWCSIHSGMGGAINTNTTLGSSNFDGSIQSTVKANTTAGFSIATYSGNSTTGATIGHGLGVKPSVIICKCRSVADNWIVYHQGLNSGVDPEDYYIFLNSTSAEANSVIMLNDTAPTSSVITFQNDSTNNLNGRTYVMYCFSEVAGYSKFGNYTGNSSDDGTFVFTGFSVAWLMVKRANGSSTNWTILDNKRDTSNVTETRLFANSSSADSVSSGGVGSVDFLSNGFKARDSHQDGNSSSGSYIYFAFAEAPFTNARAR